MKNSIEVVHPDIYVCLQAYFYDDFYSNYIQVEFLGEDGAVLKGSCFPFLEKRYSTRCLMVESFAMM